MDDLVREFLLESYENLDRLDQDFVKLETEPGNLELLKSIFRTIHTIKGTCGFLGFTKLEALAHAGENLLSMLREGELKLTEASADVLLEMVDAVRGYLKEIEATEQEGETDTSELIARLKKVQERDGNEKGTITPVPAPTAEIVAVTNLENTEKNFAGPPKESKAPAASPTSKPAVSKPKKTKQELIQKRIGGALVQKANLRPEDVLRGLELQQDGDSRRLGEILVDMGIVTPQKVDEILRQTKPEEHKEAAIRVDVHLLEKQMNLVSELVLLRNQMLQIAAETNERNLNATVHGLNYVTSELRKNVMKTRMQPVSQLFDKLPRVVRDLSKEMGKKISLATQGGGTELDKTLLEAIKDPVTHILRNSIDHGIETPEKRREGGKAEEGTVSISAFHEGGNFHLEISDDGAGIDGSRVRDKALAKGLVTPAQIEKMSPADTVNLIFLPGLSTAEKVTNVSGRGVGMDVVKTNIERIGGRVKIDSERGRGTTIRLEIPLTLATILALTVVSGKSVFAIPQAALVELIGLDPDNARSQLERIDGVSVFRFRGTVLPLLALREELRLQDAAQKNLQTINLVVVRTEGRQIALQVDSVRSTEEIVIKPLDKRFKQIALYSGAAVLGDGRVALILDIAALSRRAGMITSREVRDEQKEAERSREKLALLLVAGPDGERMAIPLDWVQRLEEFDCNAKEPLAGRFVMQYRGAILPVVELSDLLDERRSQRRTPEGLNPAEAAGKMSAVVVRSGTAETIILQVHRILGITKVEVETLHPPSRGGVRGTLVVQERVTELLEMETLLKRVQEWTDTKGVAKAPSAEAPAEEAETIHAD
jgi:two-component system, chemotaxis family, sensor kinase CheA